MDDQTTKLLQNAFDSLDRLFDGHSQAIDVWSLLFATTAALDGTEHFEPLETVVANVLKVVRSGLSAEDEQDQALVATSQLRRYLARLPLD